MTVNGTGVHQVNMDFTALMVYNLLVVVLTSNIDSFQTVVGLIIVIYYKYYYDY